MILLLQFSLKLSRLSLRCLPFIRLLVFFFIFLMIFHFLIYSFFSFSPKIFIFSIFSSLLLRRRRLLLLHDFPHFPFWNVSDLKTDSESHIFHPTNDFAHYFKVLFHWGRKTRTFLGWRNLQGRWNQRPYRFQALLQLVNAFKKTLYPLLNFVSRFFWYFVLK